MRGVPAAPTTNSSSTTALTEGLSNLATLLTACTAGVSVHVQVPYFPPLQSPAQFTPELCRDIIQAAAGFTQQQQQQQASSGVHGPVSTAADACQVHSIKPWVMSSEVADEYAAWGNRLLLAGDAAHRCAASVELRHSAPATGQHGYIYPSPCFVWSLQFHAKHRPLPACAVPCHAV